MQVIKVSASDMESIKFTGNTDSGYLMIPDELFLDMWRNYTNVDEEALAFWDTIRNANKWSLKELEGYREQH